MTPDPDISGGVGALSPSTIRFSIRPAQYVYFPSDLEKHYPDFAACGFKMKSGELRIYSGKGKTDLIVKGHRLGQVLSPKYRVNLTWNPPAYYTTVMEAAVHDHDRGVTHGYVHIETWTGDVGASWFHGEVTYSKSLDGGISWAPAQFTKRDYVVSSAGPYRNGGKNTGCGAHWVTDAGTYYYMYYVDMWAEYPDGRHAPARCMARALKTAAGPGGWRKFYRGEWSQPGAVFGAPQEQQGLCSAMADIYGTSVTPVNIRQGGQAQKIFVNIPPSFVGYMSVSLDGHNWQRTTGNLMPNLQPQTAGEAAISNPWYEGYHSLLEDENGNYFMYAFIISSVNTGDNRAIVRYPMEFERATVPGCAGRIALARYVQGSEVRVTYQAVDTRVWTKTGEICFLSVCYGRFLQRLVECISMPSGQHFVAMQGECAMGRRAPDGGSVLYYGAAGQSRAMFKPGLVPLYRCYYANRRHYDYSTSATTTCGAGAVLLGFVMPAGSSWSQGGLASLEADPFYDPSYNYTYPEDSSQWDMSPVGPGAEIGDASPPLGP